MCKKSRVAKQAVDGYKQMKQFRQVGKAQIVKGSICHIRQFGLHPKKQEKPLNESSLIRLFQNGSTSCSGQRGWRIVEDGRGSERSEISGRKLMLTQVQGKDELMVGSSSAKRCLSIKLEKVVLYFFLN